MKQIAWSDDCYRSDVYVMFTQMSAKQGIKQLKDCSVAVIVK